MTTLKEYHNLLQKLRPIVLKFGTHTVHINEITLHFRGKIFGLLHGIDMIVLCVFGHCFTF